MYWGDLLLSRMTSIDHYSIENEEWELLESLPGEARVAGTQFSFNGLGYVLSGDGDNHSSMETGEFWSYDPVSDSWTQLPPHPGTSRWAPASFIINGEVYLINGTTYSNALCDVTLH